MVTRSCARKVTVPEGIDHEKFVDDDCSCEYRKHVVQGVRKRFVRRPVERSSETP